MKKMFLVAYFFAFSLTGLMSMDGNNKITMEFIITNVSEELQKELTETLQSLVNNKTKEEIEAFIRDLKDLNADFKTRLKIRGKKAWANAKDFGGKLKEKTANSWEKIKGNKGKVAAAAVGLAALGGSAYFFREGLAQNIHTVSQQALKAGKSAWGYVGEIPGKFKRG
jgi:Ribonuclease G/E